MFSKLLNIIFPKICIFCNKQNEYVCINCTNSLGKNTITYLNKDNLFPLYTYSDPKVRRLIKLFKYKHIHSLQKNMGELLCKYIEETLKSRHNFQKAVLVPIPTTKLNLTHRGYNQAELLAKSIASCKPKLFSVEKILAKKIGSQSQTKQKTKSERIKNTKNTFTLTKKPDLHNKTIILIDDVITTASTMYSAKKLLQKSFNNPIYGFAFAHQPKYKWYV